MRPFFAMSLAALVAGGCTPAPVVTSGTFDKSFLLTMQRGSGEIVVLTSGRATYRVTNHAMSHPMGGRPDTEATFVTPAGTFTVSDRNRPDGLTINGEFYPHPADGRGRYAITIDRTGRITRDRPVPARPETP